MCHLSVRNLGLPSNLNLIEVSHEKWRKGNIPFSHLKFLQMSVPGVMIQRQTEQSVSDSGTLALVLTSVSDSSADSLSAAGEMLCATRSAVRLFIKVINI